MGELRTCTDGESVPFDPDSTDPKHVIAKALAEYDGWGEIRPGHRYQANAVVRALKAKSLLAPTRRTFTTPEEPGDEVTAVKDRDGSRWTRSWSGTSGRSGWYCDEMGIAKPWPYLLMFAPLTDDSLDAQRPEERSDEGPKDRAVRCSCDECEERRAAGLPVDGEERK